MLPKTLGCLLRLDAPENLSMGSEGSNAKCGGCDAAAGGAVGNRLDVIVEMRCRILVEEDFARWAALSVWWSLENSEPPLESAIALSPKRHDRGRRLLVL